MTVQLNSSPIEPRLEFVERENTVKLRKKSEAREETKGCEKAKACARVRKESADAEHGNLTDASPKPTRQINQ
jgi:hypothetical protein